MPRARTTVGSAAVAVASAVPLGVPAAGAADLDPSIARAVDAAGVKQRRVALPQAGLIRARLTGARGDWDLAVFDRRGNLVAGSAGFTGNELAEGYAAAGLLTVQACRRTGRDRTARLTFDSFPLPRDGAKTVSQLVRVTTPTPGDKNRLSGLGLDLTEHGGPRFVDVVLHGDADVAKLRNAGFAHSVIIPDLAARSLQNRRRDARYQASVADSGLPSGRTDYRRLAEIEQELETLAERNPKLVKPLVLPHKSLEQRTIQGIEITENA